MNFIRRWNRGNFYLLKPVLKFGDLLQGWKFAINAKFKHSISKITQARPKEHRDMGCEYHYSRPNVNIIIVKEL